MKRQRTKGAKKYSYGKPEARPGGNTCTYGEMAE
jgi:hypothetical protein